jgi:UDP-N-acetylmuramate--alanine ligase
LNATRRINRPLPGSRKGFSFGAPGGAHRGKRAAWAFAALRIMLSSMKRVHFVGVSGIGMSGAAEISMRRGMRVSGSANEDNGLTRRLRGEGMTFYLGHRAEQVDDPDAVVVSAAVPEGNPEILEARKRSIPVYLYAEYLGHLMRGKKGIAVAGTHGKTTTTSMIAAILDRAGYDPSVVCGGVMKAYGSNARFGEGECFLAEACEYNRSFLSLDHQVSLVTNIEPDHLDYYRDMEDIRGAFAEFIAATGGCAILNGDDENVRSILEGRDLAGLTTRTVGFGPENQWRVIHPACAGGTCDFSLRGGGGEMRIHLPAPGVFNCLNAGMAAVCAEFLGVPGETIVDALRSYVGTERRFDLLGSIEGNPVYSDYAHHPTEIRAVVRSIRETHPERRIVAIFQPHQYSRTFFFLDEFAQALGSADVVVVTGVYRQRDNENFARSVSGRDLYERIRREASPPGGCHFVERKELIRHLRSATPEESVLLFMGAGDIDELAREYVSL